MKITSNPNRVRMAYAACKRAQKGKRKEKARADLREVFAYYLFTRQSGAYNRPITIYAERGCTN
jgi:hypothetical protein